MAAKLPYDQAAANLAAGGLQGDALAAAQASLKGSYPAATEPVTPAKVYKGINIGKPDQIDGALSSLISASKKGANSAIDENAIYRSKLKQYQAEIDATNQIYAGQVAKAQTQGVSDLGSGRAIQARSGLLGSDFAGAQNEKIQSGTNANVSLIQQEQAAKIASILGLARKDSAADIAAKRAAQQKSTEDYLSYLGSAETRRTANTKKVAAALIAQGIDIDEADPSQLKQIAKSYGISEGDIRSVYLTEKKAKEEADAKEAREGAFSLGAGERRYDATGKLVAEGAEKPADVPTKIAEYQYALQNGLIPATTTFQAYGDTINPPTVKPPNATQQKSLGFYERAKFAQDIVQPLEQEIAKMGLAKQTALQVLPNVLQPAKNQSYRQAQRSFTEARLRQESGAAIPPAEYENDAKTYFAQPGDTSETLIQKRRARQIIVDNLAASAGPAYDEAYGSSQGSGNIIIAPDGTEVEIID